MVLMDTPSQELISKPQIIDYYVTTLETVLGSKKDAQMCIYDASCHTHFGFCCDIDEEIAQKLAGMPGVLSVKPDLDESLQKDYSMVELNFQSDLISESNLLFPLGTTKYCLIRMERPAVGVTRKTSVVDYYVQVLTRVLGNEKDAQMCIYHISWESNYGFCCVLDDQCAQELSGVPGVLPVSLDENFGSNDKYYGGDNVQQLVSPADSAPSIITNNIKTKKLFITGLSFCTSEKTLCASFEGFGEIVEVKIIMDKISKRSKGYGFVEFTTEDAASTALREMNGKIINGWMITVDVAKTNAPKYNRAKSPILSREVKMKRIGFSNTCPAASVDLTAYTMDGFFMQTQFKVIKIENVNQGGGRVLYITFSAVQVKRTKPEDTKMVELKSSTIHQEPDGWYFIRGMTMPFLDVLTSLSSDLKSGKKENKEELNPGGALDWRATQDEIEDENAICKIFQAVVHRYYFTGERTVEFCRPVDEKKVGRWKKHGLPSEVPGAGPVEEKKSKVPARPRTKEAHGEQVRMCLRNLTLIYKDDCAEREVALVTLATLITKFIRNLRNDRCEKVRKIRLAGDDFQDGVGKLEGCIQFLEACGFEKIEGGKFLYLPKGEDIGLFIYAGLELGWIIHNVEYSGWSIYSGFK